MSVKRTPKLCGSDVEVGNFVLSQGGEVASALTTGPQASRALLAEVDGAGDEQQGYWSGQVYYNAQDWGRKYLHSNGGCIYIDLNHLELCTPEVVSAWDQVAAHYALLRIARSAQEQANAELGEGQEIQVLINNSDGRSNSYGSHLNFLVDRDTWNNIFHHKLHQMLFLASHQVSSIVLTGQGKVGS